MNYEENEVIKLTQQLVRIDSTNPGAQETEVGNFVYDWLDKIGAKPVKDEFEPGRFNVIAEVVGTEEVPPLVLTCHMDTVPINPNEWKVEPLCGQIENGKIWGRGASDMKCGVAIGMILIRDMLQKEEKPKRTVRLIVTSDEEGLMLGAVRAVESGYATKDDYVVDIDSSSNQILSGHKGKAWIEIITHGKETHVSTPEDGADAILGMAEIICGINRRIEATEENINFGKSHAAFTKIFGGKSISIIPDECHELIDFRMVPPYDVNDAYRFIEEAIQDAQKVVPGMSGEWKKIQEKPVVDFNPKSEIVIACQNAYRKATGREASVLTMSGYTDSGVVAALTGNENCITFGPGLYSQAHKVDEYADCQLILDAYKIYQELFKEFVY